jgi:predicted transcriptional regulator
VNEVDRDLAYREIQDMIRLGIVARPSGPYGRTYFVVEPSAARPLPYDLTSILDILSTQGYVTNQDLREAWGVSRHVAWKQAKRLVEEGLLRQEGEKRGTRYYPTDGLKAMLPRSS